MNQKTAARKIYLNKAQELVNLVKAWSLYAVLGRGTGKSTRILSLRTIDAVFQMPGSCLCFFGNSYLNLASNLIPKVISGWREFGYVEGWDFVVGIPPPPHFKPLLSPSPENWRHSVAWANGTIFHLGSNDRLANILSHSFQHFFGDEARIIDYEKVSSNAFPTLRGERIKFGNCPMYNGFSFTTDMPDPESGQWLLEKENVMNKEQIDLIILLALEENRLLLMLSDPANLQSKDKIVPEVTLVRKELAALRQKSVHYLQGSSLINIDALGIDYIDTMYETLSWSGFKSGILNIQSPEEEKMFYFKLNSATLLQPAFNYSSLDRHDLRGDYTHNSSFDLNTLPDLELYAAMDFGNMNSIVFAQKLPGEFRCVKNLHVLQPQFIDDLADNVCDYYKFHKNKKMYIDYDRAGNNRMPNSNKTVIQQFVDRILSKKQGWQVFPRSINMGNVYHNDRRALGNRLLAGIIPGAPKISFDEPNTKELISSLRIAKVKPGTNDQKDKSSEKKRNLQMLPMYSTNYSDCFDYLLWGNFSQLVGKSYIGDLSASVK